MKKRLEEMIRVDHAGEHGAVQIYAGQKAVFAHKKGKEKTHALLEEMEQQEQEHLAYFDEMILKKDMRPTLLAPLWNKAGYAMGVITALMGEKAAMACTMAVEEVIDNHYQSQIEELETIDGAKPLQKTLKRFRADEQAHHDTAKAAGAEQAKGYFFLSNGIKAACRAAIRISEKL
ncbi:MAG: demethoxyubiquinone hydroxylase family protein [Parvibaculales bacterium]